jgi:8-oxo-dGTP pyrophosphatase MutT (NUDIX family)
MSHKYPVSIKGVIWYGDGIVLVRNPRGELELPGGRIESGEEPSETLTREISEELGIIINAGDFLSSGLFEVIPRKYVFIEVFECNILVDTDMILSTEHTELTVLTPEDAVYRVDLPDFYKRSIAVAYARLMQQNK